MDNLLSRRPSLVGEHQLHGPVIVQIHDNRSLQIHCQRPIVFVHNCEDLSLVEIPDTQILHLLVSNRRLVIRNPCGGVGHDECQLGSFGRLEPVEQPVVIRLKQSVLRVTGEPEQPRGESNQAALVDFDQSESRGLYIHETCFPGDPTSNPWFPPIPTADEHPVPNTTLWGHAHSPWSVCHRQDGRDFDNTPPLWSGNRKEVCSCRTMRVLLSTLVAVSLQGCGTTPEAPASAPIAEPAERPLALIGHDRITQADLWPRLLEASGSEIIDDLALSIAVEQALRDQGIHLKTEDLAAERLILLETIRADSPPAMLDELLARRGLGPNRADDLLRRSAGLRKLVQGDVKVTPAAIAGMYDITWGPRTPARIIVTANREDAVSAARKIRGGAAFSDVAVRCSIDASRDRGGLVEPINQADPAWPKAIRTTLAALPSMGVSPPMLVNGRWVMIQRTGESAMESAPPLADIEPEVRRLARLAQERVLMERLAHRLSSAIDVSIYDEAVRTAIRSAGSRAVQGR